MCWLRRWSIASLGCCQQLHLHLIIVIILADCKLRLNALPDERFICRSIPGLSKDQLELCYRDHDVTLVALEGLIMAAHECQAQFQWHRWNCSVMNTKNYRNLLMRSSNLLQKGYREEAFINAISAAGVAHAIARACSQGRLLSCDCNSSLSKPSLLSSIYINNHSNSGFLQSSENSSNKRGLFLQYLESKRELKPSKNLNHKKLQKAKIVNRWKWGGCFHNLDFGLEYSRLFLDCQEIAGDLQSRINLHNNQAGRLALLNNIKLRCKCHGMSGSCELKTCWKSTADFQIVAITLKELYRKAVLVDASNLVSGDAVFISKRLPKQSQKSTDFKRDIAKDQKAFKKTHFEKFPTQSWNNDRPSKIRRKWKKLEASLLYYQRSPNYCNPEPTIDIAGTVGRQCLPSNNLNEGCTALCCGRGYQQIKELGIRACNCTFQWCCRVQCSECQFEHWISVCN